MEKMKTLAIGDYVFEIVDDAARNDISKLSGQIADQQTQLDGKQPVGNYLTSVPSEYVTEDELEEEINDLKAQMSQQTPLYAQGNTVEEVKNWLKDNGDESKLYVGADETDPDKGYFYAYTETTVTTEGGTTPNFDNLMDDSRTVVKTDLRYSKSNAQWKDNTGYSGIVVPFTSGKTLELRLKNYVNGNYPQLYAGNSVDSFDLEPSSSIWSGTPDNDGVLTITTTTTISRNYICFVVANECVDDLIVTLNQPITYTTTEGGTEIITAWTNTGFAFVPADYEERIINLEREVETLNRQLDNVSANQLSVCEVFAPSPQLPADGSETADFNGDWDYITAEQIYAKIDELLNLYPRFITKEVMGKDESGTHDWCRYTLCKRAYDAWQKPNYPPMYAWVNSSTVIYSVSVSPRIGDTLYTTAYIGTSKGTVTAVSNANQTRTVGGVVYTRDKTKDVEPTLVYTETAYSPYFSSNYTNSKKGIYDGTKSNISTISSMGNGTLTGANGITYTRYPLGDRNSKFEEIPSIVIGANEHGTGGDPATPAMINARIIKDLCECKNANNPFLNLLKNEYMMVFCPVVNPWGLHKNNKSYCNSNGVNLDRNFDTIGWHPQSQEKDNWNTGDYGGSENETQYFMNTLVASKCKLAMCNHSYGHGIDNATGEAVSGGICSYMLGGNKPKYTESLLKIAEVMASNYNLLFNQNSDIATPNTSAKTRSYFEHIGIDGVALEINSRDGFITDPNNEAKGKQFTARVMEAGYTQLLQVLYMMVDKQD